MTSRIVVKTQVEAIAVVKEIAASHGFKSIVWGTGYAVTTPHVKAVQRYFDISVSYYPQGEGYMKPSTYYSVNIRN